MLLVVGCVALFVCFLSGELYSAERRYPMAFVGRADTRRGKILFFLATALMGLAVRQLGKSYAVVATLLGSENYLAVQTLFHFVSFPTLAVAALAGYLSPRRFWLWAVAAVCLLPLEDTFLTYAPAARAGVIESSEYLGLAVYEAMYLTLLVVLCVVGVGVGAGVRLILERVSRRTVHGEGELVNAEWNVRWTRRGA